MQLRVEWSPSPAEELVTGYRVEQSNDEGATWVVAAVVNGGATHYDFTPSAQPYAFRVQAANYRGFGPYSAVVWGAEVPSAVGGLSITVVPE